MNGMCFKSFRDWDPIAVDVVSMLRTVFEIRV